MIINGTILHSTAEIMLQGNVFMSLLLPLIIITIIITNHKYTIQTRNNKLFNDCDETKYINMCA